MGITDFFSAAWDTFALPSADAEAPPQGGASTQTPASGTDEESGAEAEANKQDAKEPEEGEQGHRPSDDDEEEEEEEEEETVDPKDVLEEECRNSKECHGPKHHYDECVERVTGQIDNDGKASEDCVEECMSPRYVQHHAEGLIRTSLPPRSLRDSVRRSQALRSAQVNSPTLRSPRPLPRRRNDALVGRGPLERKTRQDTSRMTVNTRVMFRITLYHLPCQAISLPSSAVQLQSSDAGKACSGTTSLSQAVPSPDDRR
ncbi:hypothetical protein OPT61_g3334 [Boeremia exigua]|uniref:Uncharacterized protein n=1 Tax=Boeremia exigua TaxID=749465 RepID=A0ACC2IIF2_9PLEO|nr:hypothetical protein OPT61_g3334 [Boeremia exigua]